jgi:hypothetical protein
MPYYRIFLHGPGVFRYEKADWNEVSGEICEPNNIYVGTAGTRYERNPNMRDQC